MIQRAEPSHPLVCTLVPPAASTAPHRCLEIGGEEESFNKCKFALRISTRAEMKSSLSVVQSLCNVPLATACSGTAKKATQIVPGYKTLRNSSSLGNGEWNQDQDEDDWGRNYTQCEKSPDRERWHFSSASFRCIAYSIPDGQLLFFLIPKQQRRSEVGLDFPIVPYFV